VLDGHLVANGISATFWGMTETAKKQGRVNPGYPDSTDSPGLFALACTCGHWSSVGTAAEVLE
jgi:hypothetical protein